MSKSLVKLQEKYHNKTGTKVIDKTIEQSGKFMNIVEE